MKVLVTGGAGFIGYHVVKKLLKENADVTVIDNLSTGLMSNLIPDADFFKNDICDKPSLEKMFNAKQFDCVVHLAAQTMVPKSFEVPDYDCHVNVLGTVNVLEVARKNNVKRIVFASSAAVYGDNADLPIAEASTTIPTSFYGLSKLIVEKYLALYAKAFGLEYFSLRFANVYGERQGDSGEGGVISIFMRRIVGNQPIHIFGDGNQTRDFIYAGDIARAVYQALIVKEADNILNISTQTEVSIKDLVQVLAAISGRKVQTLYQPARDGDIYQSILSNRQSRQRLEWEPAYELQSGLQKTYEYLSNHLNSK